MFLNERRTKPEGVISPVFSTLRLTRDTSDSAVELSPRVEHAGLRAPCSGARFGDPGQRCGEGPVSAAARLRSGSFWSGSACHNADDTGASWSLERKSNGDGEGVTRALAPLCFGEKLAYSPLGVGAELERGEVVQRCPGKQCPGGFAARSFVRGRSFV